MSFDVFTLSFCNEQGVKSKHEKAMNKKKAKANELRVFGEFVCVEKRVLLWVSEERGDDVTVTLKMAGVKERAEKKKVSEVCGSAQEE